MHRHKYVGRKFGREKGPREALLKNLATSLILHERVETTLAKAKEIRPIVEKIITKGKKGDLAARRQLLKKLPENATAKVIAELIRDSSIARLEFAEHGIHRDDKIHMKLFKAVQDIIKSY